MLMPIARLTAVLPVVVLALAACNRTASAPPAPAPGAVPGVTPSTFRLPEGGGCAGEIARFEAVMRNDVDTGNVGRKVYERATGDLGRASGACSAGRDSEALAQLSATKARYGYR